MYDPFLNTIRMLHIEVLWQMLLMIKESVEILEKQSVAQEKSKDYKNYYKSFKYLNQYIRNNYLYSLLIVTM